MKILVISPVYSLSGVPLAQLRLAKALGEIGHNVDLIYGKKKYPNLKKEKKIKLIFLNKITTLGMFFPIIKYIFFKKPDIIFSAEDHLNVLVVLACIITFSKAKLSVSSRVTPLDTYKNSNIIFSKHWFLKKMFPIVNLRANVLTCVSKDMVKQYKKIFPYSKQVSVYNIISTKDAYHKMKRKNIHKWFKDKKNQIIIAAGSLAKWKGFDDLVKSISIIDKKDKNYKFKLAIIGEGTEKKELDKLILKNKLRHRVKIFKPVINLLKYFYNADIFVLSSRVEGMPNVMLEAMMCGCTIVSTNCKTGPKEIIGKNKFGYLAKVNNPVDLSKKIKLALNKKINKNKTEKILRKFSSKQILKKHFSLLKIERQDWLI